MNGRYVHVSPHGERKEERHIYSLKSVCFYEKQTPLQYLHELLIFFFLSFFYVVVYKGWFVLKGFIATKKYFTHFPVWEGTK